MAENLGHEAEDLLQVRVRSLVRVFREAHSQNNNDSLRSPMRSRRPTFLVSRRSLRRRQLKSRKLLLLRLLLLLLPATTRRRMRGRPSWMHTS